MNALEKLHETIDNSGWDASNNDKINKAFQEANTQLESAGQIELLRKSEREREVFAFNKNPDNKLSFQFAGIKNLEDGTEVPFEWPDLKEWKREEDFDYIRERFNQSKNFFAKSEYGLFLFYSNKLSNEESLILFELVYQLADYYYNKALEAGAHDHSIIYFYAALKNALHIAFFKRNAPGFTNQMYRAILLAEEAHKNWNKIPKVTLRMILDISELAIKYFDEFTKYLKMKEFFSRNQEAALQLEKTYLLGAVYITDENIKLAPLIGYNIKDLTGYKAALNEKLYEEAKGTRFLAALHFLEIAMKLYRDVGNNEKMQEMEKLYQEKRTNIQLGTIQQELDPKESKRLKNLIIEEVKSKDESGIIISIITGPMFSKLELIREMAEESKKENPFLFYAGASVIDKYGNTIAVYTSEKDRELYNFWQSYEFQFQLGVQLLTRFFMEALNSTKISFGSIKKWIDASWLGEHEKREYNGIPFDFCLANTIYPGIKLFFDEIAEWKETNIYPNFVCVIDSLALKIEKILREFCNRIEIPIFKEKKEKDGFLLKNEKNIDQLLSDLETLSVGKSSFSEEDRLFIKFVLTEKAGQNLRHRVAHGLMDIEDYYLESALVCLTIILKLSAYKFHKV